MNEKNNDIVSRQKIIISMLRIANWWTRVRALLLCFPMYAFFHYNPQTTNDLIPIIYKGSIFVFIYIEIGLKIKSINNTVDVEAEKIRKFEK